MEVNRPTYGKLQQIVFRRLVRQGMSRDRERERESEGERERDACTLLIGIVRNAMFFISLTLGMVESRLGRAAGAEICGARANQEWRTTVARSTCTCQNRKNLTVPQRFLK